jgi:shikimate kinase
VPRIFIIGFMGSGKSTVGKAFAERHRFPFADLDEIIEGDEGKTIAGIFSEKGEEYFRLKERFHLLSLLQYKDVVVATGGGTPCFFDNMHWMNHHGFTIYLQLKATELERRLESEQRQRPVLKNIKKGELLTFITHKLKERERFYHQANCLLKADDLTVHETMDRMQELFFHH